MSSHQSKAVRWKQLHELANSIGIGVGRELEPNRSGAQHLGRESFDRRDSYDLLPFDLSSSKYPPESRHELHPIRGTRSRRRLAPQIRRTVTQSQSFRHSSTNVPLRLQAILTALSVVRAQVIVKTHCAPSPSSCIGLHRPACPVSSSNQASMLCI
ncbi:hypothetical protein GE09DRAFT_357662 [Coniochaeta sp. 2T2.1]|nr:hypothetical protein GE09DRAFT_357662 [Coniochaeta sp. 2T2.1]